MSISLSDLIWANFEILALISGYSDYADSISVISEIQWAKEGGIGVYLWMLIDIWVILYFSKKRKLPIMKYDIAFYNLYYIGLLLSNIIAGTYFDRVNIYFQNFRIIIYAIFFSNIFISNNRFLQKTFSVTILIVLLVFFYMGISNKASMCAPYQFISI